MGRIAGWVMAKAYRGDNPSRDTMYINTLPQFKDFQNNCRITLGKIGNTDEYSINLIKGGKSIILANNIYSYIKAKKIASRYMRTHPRG